jgi:hypothetical protein
LLESCVIQAKAALKGLKATTAVQVNEPDPVDEEERLRMTAEEWEAKRTKKAKNNDAQNAELEAFWWVHLPSCGRRRKRLVLSRSSELTLVIASESSRARRGSTSAWWRPKARTL